MPRRLAPALLAVTLLLGGMAAARAANPDALWQIIHDQCVPNMTVRGSPAPCTEVDLKGGTVLLKDLVGIAQFLLMPTAKITGIEDPAILAPDAPNYFAAAWAARAHVSALLPRPLPRDATSLAINSEAGRTQNQLHIHVDCLRADIRATLATATIDDTWAPLPGGLAGHPYQAMRLPGADLTANPFRLLPAADLGRQTLVVVGAADGFILITDRVNLAAGDRASGEELQDHTCHGY
jgi:CDP-diacylglycerol pyrophosphatase